MRHLLGVIALAVSIGFFGSIIGLIGPLGLVVALPLCASVIVVEIAKDVRYNRKLRTVPQT